ncbi:MAG: hypothetical protein AAGD38_13085, partial [Acidobacteriota bacterium]
MRASLHRLLTFLAVVPLTASLAFAQPPIPITPDFPINTSSMGNRSAPDVARNRNGATIIVWESDSQDGDGYGIYGRLFADGTNGGTEILFPQNTMGDQRNPDASIAADGAFYVAWETPDMDGRGIAFRLYDANGQPIVGERTANETEDGGQNSPATAIIEAGLEGVTGAWTLICVWEGPNGNDSDVFARIYQFFDDGSTFF